MMIFVCSAILTSDLMMGDDDDDDDNLVIFSFLFISVSRFFVLHAHEFLIWFEIVAVS